MRRLMLTVVLALALSGCGLIGGSDADEEPLDVDAVADVNGDLVSFRCHEREAPEPDADAADEDGDEDAAEETVREGWTARGRIENSTPMARSYLVIAFAGDPGVEFEASTLVVEDVAPGESETFRIEEVNAQADADGCFVRLEEFTGEG